MTSDHARGGPRDCDGYYRRLFDSIDEGFCVIEVLLDPDGSARDYVFLETNAAFERQTGLVDAVGRRMRELAPDHEAHWFEMYAQVVRTGEARRFELPARALGRYYDVYAFRLGEAGERRVGILFNDVRRRKEAEEEGRRRAEFEQQLIGMVSHDLRQPLQAIRLWATVLGHRPDLDEDAHDIASRIVEATDRMSRMLVELLDFTRARLTGGIPIARGPADLGRVVADAVREARHVHPGRAVSVEVEGDVAGTWDAGRLGQVVANLVGNALAYGAEHAPVAVDVRGEDADVVLRVHNEGAPIEPDLLPRLFEPMTRGRSADAPRGVGLGLFIVDQVVRAHGGRVEVRSTAEDGTTFTVRLPRVAEEPRAA